jgi:hypothetical protein
MKVVALALVAALCSTPATAGFRGAFVHKGPGEEQAVPGSFFKGVWERVKFGTVAYDTDHLWNAERSEFVIPEGVHFVRLAGQIVFSHGTVGARQTLITKNGALFDGYAAQNSNATMGTTPDMNVVTAVLPVNAGDTFQLQAWQLQTEDDPTLNIYGNGGTWFSIEVVE